MATIRERLVYAIEVVTDQAQQGIKGFKSAVTDAEGATAKFKAGASSALASISANAGLLAATGGAAVVAYSFKAIGAFTNTAKAALDLSTSTGLAIEQASRWIAVGDDYGVTAEALATGLGKVAKTLDDEKWSKYGIATRDASGAARDVNDILLDSFDTLSAITNETERARVGQELFGKGYQSLTPILGHTREEYEKMLAAQSKGQVITEAEAKKAEKARLAFDTLHDTLVELSLALGQSLAPAAADSAEQLAFLIAKGQELVGVLEQIPGATNDAGLGLLDVAEGTVNPAKQIDNLRAAWEGFRDAIGQGDKPDLGSVFDDVPNSADAAKGAYARMRAEMDQTGESVEHLAWEHKQFQEGMESLPPAIDAVTDAQSRWSEAVDGTRDAYKDLNDAVSGLRDEIGQGALLDDIKQSFDDLAEARKAAADGGEEEQRAYRDQVRRTQLQLLDMLDTLQDISGTRRAEIVAEIRAGDLEHLEAALDDLTRGRTIPISFVTGTLNPGFDSANIAFGQGSIPQLTFNSTRQPAPTYIDSSTTINIQPNGTSPNQQAINDRIFARRGGFQ